jgi:hypothetical protein
MSSYVRVLLFCVSLIVAPITWAVGLQLGNEIAGAAIGLVLIIATAVYASVGQPKPPAGAQPS